MGSGHDGARIVRADIRTDGLDLSIREIERLIVEFERLEAQRQADEDEMIAIMLLAA